MFILYPPDERLFLLVWRQLERGKNGSLRFDNRSCQEYPLRTELSTKCELWLTPIWRRLRKRLRSLKDHGIFLYCTDTSTREWNPGEMSLFLPQLDLTASSARFWSFLRRKIAATASPLSFCMWFSWFRWLTIRSRNLNSRGISASSVGNWSKQLFQDIFVKKGINTFLNSSQGLTKVIWVTPRLIFWANENPSSEKRLKSTSFNFVARSAALRPLQRRFTAKTSQPASLA